MTDQNWHQLWVNMHIATMNGDAENPLGIILNGALATDHQGNIAFVGARDALPEDLSTIADFTYEMDGGWMLPGFIDCHTAMVHGGSRADMFIAQSHGQEVASEDGISKTALETSQTAPDQLLEKARQRLLTQLQTGVTCFNITARHGFDVATITKILTAATELRDEYDIPLKRGYEISNFLPGIYPDADHYCAEICDNILPHLAQASLIDQLTLPSSDIFTTEQSDKIINAAAKLQILIGKNINIITPQTAASKETKKTEEHSAIATGYSPEERPNLSLPLAMHLACQQYGISVEEALKGTTLYAAEALGISNQAGSLEIGKEAYFALYAIESPADLAYQTGIRPCQGIALKGQHISFV